MNSNTNNNLTAVFHKEIIPDTQILSSFCGKFIPILTNSCFDIPKEVKIDQICLQYSTRIKIYAIAQSKKNKEYNTLYLLNTYKVFDDIKYADKFNSLNSKNKSLNSIILSLSNYKISIIEYNILYNTFNTIALYSIDKFILTGKIKTEQTFRVVSSLTYNYITFIFDENKLFFLRKKSEKKINKEIKENISDNTENKKQKIKSHAYSDTIGGNKFFLPSIYLTELYNKYNIYKIINIYIPNKNLEIFNYENSDSEDSNEQIDKIHIYILYITKNDLEQNNNNFFRNIINIALLSYNFKNNECIDFKILFSGVDENAFDFTILEKEDMKENTAIIFSAYNLQIIYLKKKTSVNYIINDEYYNLIFSKLYSNQQKYILGQKFYEGKMDLRGGGYLVLNSNCLFFSDSQGKIFFADVDISKIDFIQLNIENSIKNNLGAPYNKILMPYGYFFFLSSPYSDAVFLYFDQVKQTYTIKDKIKSYSPIINFHLVNDDLISDIKFVFTHGYGDNSFISFAYRYFLYLPNDIKSPEIYDVIDYMITINHSDNNYTKFILCKTKSKKLIVFQSNNTEIINVSNQIDYNKDLNIINFGEIFINNENNNNNNFINEQIIILIFETEIKFYNKHFAMILTINLFNIEDALLSENLCLIYNTKEKKYFLLGLYDNKIQVNNSGITENMLNQNLFLRYKEIPNFIFSSENEYIKHKLNMNSKKYLNKYIFLMLYDNTTIQIYDITNYLEYKDKMIIDDNEKESNLRLVLISNMINYSPCIIFNDDLNKNNLYRSDSNLNIDFSNSINDLFNTEENINNKSKELILKNTLSFSADSPNKIYFGNLGNLVVLILAFVSGTLIIYTLYIAEMSEDNNDIKAIGFKKNLIEKLTDIDYMELHRKNNYNLFIPFDNINNNSGLFFNLQNNMKILYEINGELCSLKNKFNKSNWSSFCNYNSIYCPNGFMAYEESGESTIKFFNLIPNHNLSNNSLLIKTNKIKRFPSLLTYNPEYTTNQMTFYHYFLIEKEMISPNQFQYYLTLKKEEQENSLYEIKFPNNEIITEFSIIELQKTIGNNSGGKKYVILGIVEITQDEKLMNSKIKLYEYNKNNNNIFEFEMEKDGFKGVITIIQNLNNFNNLYNLVLIGEGPKLNIYQFKLNEQNKFTMEPIYNMNFDNKNLSISNKSTNINKNKLLLIGDIVDSFSFMYIKPNINMQNPEIHLEAKDNNHIHVTSLDFWNVDNKKCCIIFDEENNGYIYLLETNNTYRICDFRINKIINEIKTRKINDKISLSFYSANNGSIGLFQHINNDIYEKLNYLSEFIYYHFPFNSGVNPSLYYKINYTNDNNNNFQKAKGRFIDKNILDIFMNLSDKFQDIICNNLFEMGKIEIIKIISDLIYS